MKNYLVLVVCLIGLLPLKAQLNLNFEEWEDEITPVGWRVDQHTDAWRAFIGNDTAVVQGKGYSSDYGIKFTPIDASPAGLPYGMSQLRLGEEGIGIPFSKKIEFFSFHYILRENNGGYGQITFVSSKWNEEKHRRDTLFIGDSRVKIPSPFFTETTTFMERNPFHSSSLQPDTLLGFMGLLTTLTGVGESFMIIDEVVLYHPDGTSTAIKTYKETPVEVFPTVADETVAVNFSDDKLRGLKVYDAQGHLVESNEALGKTNQVDVSHLSPGQYVFVVLEKNVLVNQVRIVKK